MRRFLIAALAAGLVGAFLFPTAAIAKADKTAICHFNADDDPDTPEFELLMVKSGKTVDKHLAHGDEVPGGGVLDENCDPVELIFAVAYTDEVDDGGPYNPDVDGLISKLIDGNGNGVTDAGDTIVMGKYPEDIDAAAGFGTFGVTQHTIDFVRLSSTETIEVFDGLNDFRWFHNALGEGYREGGISIEIKDAFESGARDDVVAVATGSPSQPNTPTLDSAFRLGDDPFIDVELNFVAAP